MEDFECQNTHHQGKKPSKSPQVRYSAEGKWQIVSHSFTYAWAGEAASKKSSTLLSRSLRGLLPCWPTEEVAAEWCEYFWWKVEAGKLCFFHLLSVLLAEAAESLFTCCSNPVVEWGGAQTWRGLANWCKLPLHNAKLSSLSQAVSSCRHNKLPSWKLRCAERTMVFHIFWICLPEA